MTENSENLHMSFLCPIDWHIFFPGGFDNFNANQDTLPCIAGNNVMKCVMPEPLPEDRALANGAPGKLDTEWKTEKKTFDL